jgi:hypothetical protein
MNEFELKKAFGVIISRSDLDKNKLPVAELFYENGLTVSKKDVLSAIKGLGFKSLYDYKENALNLIIHYIYSSLNDNALSKTEKANIRFLKLVLEVKEGDFMRNPEIKAEVTDIMKIQLRLLYIDDDKIDKQEALHKVDLQEIFGLSYDEFSVFDKFEALLALQRKDRTGTDLDFTELDTLPGDGPIKYSDNLVEESTRSRKISQEVKDKVWNRDEGKCILCGSNELIEFDHIIPFSKGGANTYRNIQILCQSCNRSKSDSIGDD